MLQKPIGCHCCEIDCTKRYEIEWCTFALRFKQSIYRCKTHTERPHDQPGTPLIPILMSEGTTTVDKLIKLLFILHPELIWNCVVYSMATLLAFHRRDTQRQMNRLSLWPPRCVWMPILNIATLAASAVFLCFLCQTVYHIRYALHQIHVQPNCMLKPLQYIVYGILECVD